MGPGPPSRAEPFFLLGSIAFLQLWFTHHARWRGSFHIKYTTGRFLWAFTTRFQTITLPSFPLPLRNIITQFMESGKKTTVLSNSSTQNRQFLLEKVFFARILPFFCCQTTEKHACQTWYDHKSILQNCLRWRIKLCSFASQLYICKKRGNRPRSKHFLRSYSSLNCTCKSHKTNWWQRCVC